MQEVTLVLRNGKLETGVENAMGTKEEGLDLIFKEMIAVFIEPGVHPRRLQEMRAFERKRVLTLEAVCRLGLHVKLASMVDRLKPRLIWKQKFVQRGGEIRQHIKSVVTHIFAIDLKFLEDRVGRGRVGKLRAVLLNYKWLEECLKAGHSVASDPYLLIHDSKALNSDESQPSPTFSYNDPGSSPPTSLPLMHSPQAQNRGEQSDEPSNKRRKSDDDWMSVIRKGANAGRRGRSVAHADGASISDGPSESLDLASQDQRQPIPIQETELTYSPPNLNKNITDIFGELRSIYGDALGDDRRSFSYHKANSVLEKLPFKITSVDQVKGLPSVGVSLQEKIGEILRTGTVAKLEHFKKDEKVSAISQISAVWGIGPKTARKLYAKGHRTLNDLLSDESLTSAQKIGLRYHDDINKKMPRHEVKEMETIIRKVAESVEKDVILVCGGSYRRGKTLIGDMDIVITHPDGKSHVGLLRKLMQQLKEIDFLTEDLRISIDHDPSGVERYVDTYFGLCKYPGREQRHRIDFKVYPYEKFPYGLIAWTGNDVLNRRLRLLADSKGYRLDDHGCFPVMKDADGQEVANRSCSVPCKTEREVFDLLGFPWLEPHERNL